MGLLPGEQRLHLAGVPLRAALDERWQYEEAPGPAGLRLDEHDAGGGVRRAVDEAQALGVEALVGQGRQQRPQLLRAVHEAHPCALAGDLPRGVDEALELAAARRASAGRT